MNLEKRKILLVSFNFGTSTIIYSGKIEGITTTDMLKIISLKNECMHKLGAGLVSKYDNDIRLLNRSLNEENNKINTIKKSLIRISDVEGSNVVYKNNLKLHATQPLRDDTQTKIREYLNDHLTNFKPPNSQSQSLIE